MQYTLTAVTAPSYAPDGSHGYQLTVGWSATCVNPVDGKHIRTGTEYGWVERLPDGCVVATLDGRPWQDVESDVTDSEWSDAWVWSHGSDIIDAAHSSSTP